MNFIACGINHKTAPIALREQVIFSAHNAPDALRDLLACGAANEAIILSTCNRTEVYTHLPDADASRLVSWLARHPQTASVIDSTHWYWHHSQQAVSHIMRVASGLDSMVIGEPQILGQMKQAFELAQQTGTVGSQLHRLLQRVFAVTKQVRTNTGIGASPVSVAYAAVALAKRIYTQLSKCQVLLIGSGQTIELAALHLSDFGVKRITVANRSLTKAQRIAQQLNGNAIGLADIPLYLQNADIVITATASTLPIIGKGMVERALKSGKRRPLLMIDLAVPRDIEPEAADLEDVYLYNMDNLQEIVQENLKLRHESASCAEQMIDIQARYFMRQLQALSAVDTIRAYRGKLEGLCQEELSKARAAIQKGSDPHQVLDEMARALTNKIMHTPTTQLKQASFDGQAEVLLLARRLFDL
jgi:glutamyl-tRNA reductase